MLARHFGFFKENVQHQGQVVFKWQD
jgi:hypothetical protein